MIPLPGELPAACLSCGGTSLPVTDHRCLACEAVLGPASQRELVADVLARVRPRLDRRAS